MHINKKHQLFELSYSNHWQSSNKSTIDDCGHEKSAKTHQLKRNSNCIHYTVDVWYHLHSHWSSDDCGVVNRLIEWSLPSPASLASRRSSWPPSTFHRSIMLNHSSMVYVRWPDERAFHHFHRSAVPFRVQHFSPFFFFHFSAIFFNYNSLSD